MEAGRELIEGVRNENSKISSYPSKEGNAVSKFYSLKKMLFLFCDLFPSSRYVCILEHARCSFYSPLTHMYCK